MWHLLLPGTPFPACGVPENSKADVRERASAANPRDGEACAAAPEPGARVGESR
jgi:hypothetical protein